MADTFSDTDQRRKPNAALPADRRTPRSPDDPDVGAESVQDYMSIGLDDEPESEIAPDGSLIITMDDPYENPETASDEFYENLVLILPQNELTRIGTEIMRYVDEDKEARKPRDTQRADAIKRSNLGNEAPGGAEFDGASRAAHPMIAEASIDFEARVMKELWPPSGPVKPRIVGAVTRQKTERANRKVEHMNWQLTTQIKEAYSTLETALIQDSLGGGAYITLVWDHRLKRPRMGMITVDRVWLPHDATDFYSAHRKTYSETLSAVEFRQRIDSREYADVGLSPPSMRPDQTKSEEASAKVEGKVDPGMNLDGSREIYTVSAFLAMSEEMAELLGAEEPGVLYPYLLMIDGSEGGSHKLVGLYRNWEEGDETREALDHIYDIPFIPWEGGYSIGLSQLIGSLAGAATGAMRAILDSAFTRNSVGGLILKGSGTTAQTRRPKIGEYTEVDGSLEAKDIRQLVMPYSFGAPDPQLFQMLSFVVNASREVIQTTVDESRMNQNTNQPVGTRLSVVEEGLVVFSQIHGRIHQAINRLLAGLHRLNRLYLPDQVKADADGKEIMVRRRDYEGPCDIQPVSDPTVFSEQQRYAQDVAIQQRSTQVPQLYNVRYVEERWLRRQKIGDDEIKKLLVDQPQPHEMNASNEALAMSMGTPVVVFPEQNHLAHIESHLQYLASPLFGSNPLIAPRFIPGALKHIADHIAFAYVTVVHQIVSRAAGMEASLLLSSDPQVKRKLDELLAIAGASALSYLAPILEKAQPILTQAMAQLKSMQPPQPVDPAGAAVQASLAETSRKTQADQVGAQTDQAKLSLQAQGQQQENAINWAKVQAMIDDSLRTAQAKLQTTQMDNATAEQISDDRLDAGSQPGFSTGRSMEGG